MIILPETALNFYMAAKYAKLLEFGILLDPFRNKIATFLCSINNP